MKTLANRISEFNAARQPATLALKYQLMARDEFSFFRATCHLFYQDLGHRAELNRGPLVWVCGDVHLENFGSYRASNGLAYFDINDFDEAALAHAPWDLVRFLASIGMASDLWQYSMKEARELMALALQAYTDQLAGGKAYAIQEEASDALIVKFFEMAKKEKEKDMIKDRVDARREQLRIIDGKTLALGDNQKAAVIESTGQFLQEHFEFLEIKDSAFRIAGTGSLGVRRYVVLTYDNRKEKWRLLDIKEACPSSLAPYLQVPQPPWPSEGERISGVQSMMQYALPRFMGTLKIEGQSFVLKQLQPSNQKFDNHLCDGKMKNVETVMVTMAQALASAQLRSASRRGSAGVEALMAFARDASWTAGLTHVAMEYTETMKRYYLEFVQLYRLGKI